MCARLLAGGLIALGLIASSCGESEHAGPPTVLIAADPLLLDSALAEARGVLAPQDLLVEQTVDRESAHIVVETVSAADSSAPFVTRYWAVAVALRAPGGDVTMTELSQAVRGERRVLVPATPQPPLALWFGDIEVTAETTALNDIPNVLADDPSAFAFMPLDAVDARLRTMAVDGVSIVFGNGDIGAYPLFEGGRVTLAQDAQELIAQPDAVARGLTLRLSTPPPDPIVLRATGDILPVRCTYARMLEYGDLTRAFHELGPWLAEADIAVGSLDAALSDSGTPLGCVETFSLMGPSAATDGLELAGFDVITVATNHIKDCGESPCGDLPLFDSLENLRSRGIAPVGGGADLAEARAPALITVDGVRFAFLGYDEIASYYHAGPGVPGTAPLEEAYVWEDVAAAARHADVVVVLPQWGVEYTADPTARQLDLAAAAVEAGATLVIGNHPHWVQAAEVIDGAFVAYALGNFVFDQDWSLETQQGAVLEVAFHGSQLKGIRYHPVYIYDEHQPRLADPVEAQQILDRIWDASERLPRR